MAQVNPGRIKVRLRYSQDGGTTWLPASPIDLWSGQYSCTVPPEQCIEQKFEQYGRIRSVNKGRIYITIKFDEDQFGTIHDSSDANLLHVEAWLRGTLLRIWTHDGAGSPSGVNVDGKSYFATETNTNYVITDEGTEPDIHSDFLKSFTIKVKSRDRV